MSDLPRTLTQTSAHSASSSSSHSHAHSHSSFVRAILPHSHKKDGHHSHSHHGRSSSHVRAAHVTPPSTPVALCELFLNVMFTHPSGRSLDEIQAELGPRLVHRAYVHRVNCRECDVEEMWEMARFFRTKFDSSRLASSGTGGEGRQRLGGGAKLIAGNRMRRAGSGSNTS